MTLNPRAWTGENPERSGYSSLLSQTKSPKVSVTNGRYGHCKVESSDWMRTHTEHGTQRRCDLAPSPEDLRPSDDEKEQEEGGKGGGDAEPKGQLFLY